MNHSINLLQFVHAVCLLEHFKIGGSFYQHDIAELAGIHIEETGSLLTCAYAALKSGNFSLFIV